MGIMCYSVVHKTVTSGFVFNGNYEDYAMFGQDVAFVTSSEVNSRVFLRGSRQFCSGSVVTNRASKDARKQETSKENFRRGGGGRGGRNDMGVWRSRKLRTKETRRERERWRSVIYISLCFLFYGEQLVRLVP